MTYDEKLDVVFKEINEAKKATRKGHLSKFYLNPDSEMAQIGIEELYNILLKLEEEEKIFTIRGISTRLKPISEQTNDLLCQVRE